MNKRGKKSELIHVALSWILCNVYWFKNKKKGNITATKKVTKKYSRTKYKENTLLISQSVWISTDLQVIWNFDERFGRKRQTICTIEVCASSRSSLDLKPFYLSR